MITRMVKDTDINLLPIWLSRNCAKSEDMWRANYEDDWDNYVTAGKED